MAKKAQQPPKSRRASRSWLVFALPALVLIAVATGYLPFLSDDALISLRYAQRLLDGHGLTWTAGDPVEGYSNLLWILAAALLGGLGVDPIDALRFLGYGCGIATVTALALSHPAARTGVGPGLLGGLVIASSGTIAVWTVGGLEQPLLVALLAWAVVAVYRVVESDRSPWPAAIPLALICLTRPDGILFAVALGAGILAARGFDKRSLGLAARLVGPSILTVASHTAFRLAYYGAWLPNTAGAKLGSGGRRLAEGAAYVGGGALWLGPVVAAAVVLAFAARSAPDAARRVRLLLPALVLWTGYVIAIGGDYFPGRRHLAPLVVLLAFVLAAALAGLRERNVTWYRSALVATAAAVVLTGVMQPFDPQNRRARAERWEWDGAVVGEMLRRGFPERPLLAVDPAGTLPYFSELPAIDMLGLADRHIATHRPADFGEGDLGHELGDGDYVLDREPDLVVFCGPGGGDVPCFRSGKEMVADPRFAERYTAVTFQGTGTRAGGPFDKTGKGEPYLFRSRIWVRREGGRVGIRREDHRVVVPSYLMMRIGTPVAKLDGPGQFVVAVDAQGAAGIDRVPLAPGNWTLQVEAEGPPLRTMVRMSDSEQMLGGGYNGADFAIRGEPGSTWPVDVLALPGGPEGEALIRRLVFTRRDPA